MTYPFVGSIYIFGGNFAPVGYQFCQGQLLSIAQNAVLFSILGSTYGGDGKTNFALPDLRGKVIVGAGPNNPLGAKGGAEKYALTLQNLPAHTHNLVAVSEPGNSAAPANNFLANTQGPDPEFRQSGTLVQMAADSLSTVGSSAAVNLMQPYLPMNYVIAVTGTFPPRN